MYVDSQGYFLGYTPKFIIIDSALNWAAAKGVKLAKNPNAAAVYGFTSTAMRIASLFAFGQTTKAILKSTSPPTAGIAPTMTAILLTQTVGIPVSIVAGIALGKMITNKLGFDLSWKEVGQLTVARGLVAYLLEK